MVDAKENNEAPEDSVEKNEDQVASLTTMEEEEYEEDDEYEDEEDEEEDEEEEGENDEEQPEEEKVSSGGNETVVVNKEQPESQKESAVKEDEKNQDAVKEDEMKQNAVNEDEDKQIAVKEDEHKQNDVKEKKKKIAVKENKKKQNAAKDKKKVEEPKSGEKPAENSKSKEKRPMSKTKKKQKDSGTLTVNGDKPESSSRKKGSKRVESMGMVFMCSSKTKADCFRYKILGLPESKKDQVLKIYRGMRLFLFDVDLRLMYGIFKAAGPGGYNIEPNAFKSEFPSQVRFTVLDECLPLAEESFKDALKENYYSRNKFEGLLKGDQVKKLCKLFLEKGRGGGRSKSGVKLRRTRPAEPRGTRREESRRDRPEARRTSRDREKRKRWARDEERRPLSPPRREKRRYTDYDRGRSPVVYDREPPVSRYLPAHPAAMGSPARLYTYERPPLDIPPPYVRDRVPEPSAYHVIDRDRDPYLAVREPPLYRDAVYPAPPEYHHVSSREYHHPSAVPAPEYRVAGPRVPDYREMEMAGDYRSSAMALPEYRSRTHYKY